MRTAVDTSVLLDVLTDDSVHGSASSLALRQAAGEGALLAFILNIPQMNPW